MKGGMAKYSEYMLPAYLYKNERPRWRPLIPLNKCKVTAFFINYGKSI